MSTRIWGNDTDKYVGINVLYRVNDGDSWITHSTIKRLWKEDYAELKQRAIVDMEIGKKYFPNFQWTMINVTSY